MATMAALGADPFLGLDVPSESYPGVSFRIERALGEGGTAVAYFATRNGPEGQSPAVLKVILPSIILQAGETAQMVVRKEAVALGRLNERIPPCPFVVRLLDVGSIEYRGRGTPIQLPWLAIEYVHGGAEGATLDDRVQASIKSTGFAFDAERAQRALRHMTEGLREIHDVGVIHRDINPNNILCCGSGQSEIYKISDFGIARPIGMQATFGNNVLGTPGYISPEQAAENEGPIGFYSDIFSLGALTYFCLTGEPYFKAANLWQVLSSAKQPERRSILDTKGLAPEIRDDQEICRAVDQALALATSADPKLRPQTARAFAASLVPWLSSCPPTRRSVPVPAAAPTGPASISGWQFSVRHPVEHDWVLSRVGWDGDGHCLGASTRGLVFFDGTKWSDVPAQSVPGISGVRFSTRVGAGRWLFGGESCTVAEYARGGITRVLRGRESGITLTDANGDLSDLAVMIGSLPGAPPLLCAVSGGRWMRPLPVPSASVLLSLTRFDDERWLLCGRGAEGKGFSAIYSPLGWDVHTLPPIETRALTACASRPERGLAISVGSEGWVMRLEHSELSAEQLPDKPDFSCVTLDVLGRAWAGAAGQLWFSDSGGKDFRRVWQDPSWRAPFVSIFADIGMVFAATADGAVLECRATLSQIFSA
jgi:serine/threonine protein kinase